MNTRPDILERNIDDENICGVTNTISHTNPIFLLKYITKEYLAIRVFGEKQSGIFHNYSSFSSVSGRYYPKELQEDKFFPHQFSRVSVLALWSFRVYSKSIKSLILTKLSLIT